MGLGRALFAAVVVVVTAFPTVEAFAHGGTALAPRHPGELPPGLPPPGDPIQHLWDTNLDELAAQDPVARVTTDGAADPELLRRRIRETKVLPFLRSVVAGKHGPDFDLRGSALIALAKTTSDPSDLALLVEASGNPSVHKMLREASALAPGLLRRTAPDQQFDAGLLDRVRVGCLDLYDRAEPSEERLRCLAILAIGLLGDQPTRTGAADGPAGPDTARELLARVKASRDVDEQVALLVALGLQARDTVAPDTIDVLRHLASTGVYARRGRGPFVQGHAMVALARLTGADASGTFLRFVRERHTDSTLRHAAMVGLGIAAARLDPLGRTVVAAELAAHAERGNPDTVGLALLTLGRLLAVAMQDPDDRDTTESPAAELLLRQIDEGPGTARRIAALATGIALRRHPKEGAAAACAAFRRRAIAALTAADVDGADPALRGAAILALGLAHDPASIARFTALLGRRDVPHDLRARAATGLGMAGDRRAGTLEALRAALEARSPEGVRSEAARALGFLGDTSALPSLLSQLRGDKSDTVRVRAASAVGAMGHPVAVDPLIQLASDKTANGQARAIAVATLGILTDPERIRSLTRLASDFDRIVLTDALAETLSLL